MTGTRFYLEFDTNAKKRRNEHTGNVFAAFVCNGRTYNGGYEGLGAIYFYPDSPVAGTAASPEFLWKRCKRISEAKARQIHPQLFTRLD